MKEICPAHTSSLRLCHRVSASVVYDTAFSNTSVRVATIDFQSRFFRSVVQRNTKTSHTSISDIFVLYCFRGSTLPLHHQDQTGLKRLIERVISYSTAHTFKARVAPFSVAPAVTICMYDIGYNLFGFSPFFNLRGFQRRNRWQ